jgi:hypothetical protein
VEEKTHREVMFTRASWESGYPEPKEIQNCIPPLCGGVGNEAVSNLDKN